MRPRRLRVGRPFEGIKASVGCMRFCWLLVLVGSGVVFLAGCQREEVVGAPTAGMEAGSGSRGEGVKSVESGRKPGEPDPEKIREAMERAKIDPRRFEIKPAGSGDWEGAVRVPGKVASLGDRVDEGLKSLEPSLCLVLLAVEDRGSSLEAAPQVKIQDSRTFSIEYLRPESRVETLRIVGDGDRRVLMKGSEVTPLPAFGPDKSGKAMGASEIDRFLREAPSEAFGWFRDGTPVWGRLARALQDRRNGFETTVEERVADPLGTKRTFYRLLAKSRSGPKRELEVVVDTLKNVPVTIRSLYTYPDGQTRRIHWTAEWNFGGRHGADDFRIK